MTEIAKFDAAAPRRGSIDVPTANGAADALAQVAQVSARLAGSLGDWADKAAIAQGKEDAAKAEMQVQMPGTDFAYAGTSPATTAVPKGKVGGTAAARAAEAKAYIMATHGKSDVYASGIVGNLMQESSLNPNAVNPGDGTDGSNSIGLAQWNGQRGRAFRAFATARGKPLNDFHTQLDFVIHELDTTESAAGRALGAARTVDEATAAYIGAERPRGWTAAHPRGGDAWARRLAYAQSVYGGGPPAPMSAAATTTPMPAASGPAAAAPGAIKVTLTGSAGPLARVQGGTLYGDAYNAAALDIHLNRLDTAMRQQMDALSLEHDGDPAGLTQALDALRGGYVKDLPPAAAALIDDSFQRQKFALTREAVTKFNANLESANQAAFEENLATRTAGVYRMAAHGGLDAEADAAISGELGALTAQIDASPMTPLQKSRAKSDAVSGVMTARVLGGFQAQKDPAARAAYAQKFQQDYLAGTGPAARLDLKTYDGINGELMRAVQADQVAANKKAEAVGGAIKTQLDTLKHGWPVSPQSRAELRGAASAIGDPNLSAHVDFIESLSDWQKAHVAARPEVIDAQIAALQAKIQKDGYSEAAGQTLDVMEGLRDEMRKGLADDPLTWANRAGVAQVDPLNFGDTASLTASLTERVADAQAIASHYGIEPKYFTPAETDGLKKMLRDTPLALPSLVSGLAAGLGAATPKALAEISKDAPLLAHVAGLTAATGSQRAAVEVAEALDRRNQPGYKSALPAAEKLQSAAAGEIGGALIALPGTYDGALQTAAALFEARAQARGIDTEQFDVAGSPARQLYLDAVDEVLGATTRGGVKYGGLTEVNGFETVAPPDLPAEQLQSMMANLSADDMLFQAPVGTANGVPITIDALRAGKLVMVGQGRYRLALGDIGAGDPRYVPDPGGGYFVLDFGMLKRTQGDRQSYAPLPTNAGNFR